MPACESGWADPGDHQRKAPPIHKTGNLALLRSLLDLQRFRIIQELGSIYIELSILQGFGNDEGGKSQASPTGDIPVSFIIRIEDLEAPFTIRGPQTGTHDYWDPPKSSKELKVSNTRFYRWKDGRITKIASLADLYKDNKQALRQHDIGSFFFQKETGHLLITNTHPAKFDESDDKKWSRLLFNHKRVTLLGRNYYTELDFAGSKEETAAPMSNHCVPQLVPSVYNTDSHPNRVNAGLIGKLPLLIAIAAFSVKKEFLNNVLTTNIRPHKWISHSYESGRSKFRSPLFDFLTDVSDEKYRGMVISICYDPSNSEGSTDESLTAVENGELGPFYD